METERDIVREMKGHIIVPMALSCPMGVRRQHVYRKEVFKCLCACKGFCVCRRGKGAILKHPTGIRSMVTCVGSGRNCHNLPMDKHGHCVCKLKCMQTGVRGKEEYNLL